MGRNVKAHCSVIGNAIISSTQWYLEKNAPLECDSLRQVLLLSGKLTPRPHLFYVLVTWLTYRVIYQNLHDVDIE